MASFDIKLSRRHLTLTSVKKLADHEFELPLYQEVRVNVQPELDTAQFFALSAAEIVALSAASIVVDSEAPADGWSPWQPVMLREAYAFVQPKPVSIAPDSPAGRLLAAALGRYPSLYRADEFAPYRVFEHWFCTIGNGLDWVNGTLTDGRPLPEPLPAQEHKAALENEASWEVRNWSESLLARPPVKLYPLSPGYSNLFEVPENVDDSFLQAAFALCQYILDRPVWQNFAYSPAELTGTDPSPRAAVWKSDDWRHIALADGMKYRTLVDQAHARLVLGPWGRKMQALGFEDRGRHLDYSLPPRARSF